MIVTVTISQYLRHCCIIIIIIIIAIIVMTNFDCNKENVSLLRHGDFVSTQKSVTSSHQQQQQQQLDWVDTVVNCANIMNKIFTRNTCRLCHIYSDKQVEFEERLQENATITATAAEWYNIQQQQGAMNSRGNETNDFDRDVMYHPQQEQQQQIEAPSSNTLIVPPNSVSSSMPPVDLEAVELYRKYLFDEESVVDSIELRIGRSTDDDGGGDEVMVDDHEEMKDVSLI